MSVKTGLRAFLVAQPSITALVSQRIGQQGNQGWDKPYVTFRQVAENPHRHLRGETLKETFLQISCYGRTQVEAAAVADAVRNSIGEGQRALTWDDTYVDFARWEDRSDDWVDPAAGEGATIPNESLTLIVWHRPA